MSIGPLNLSDADLKGFEALEPGRYDAEVFAMTMDAVKNTSGEGKLPAGTPQIKVQFKVLGPVGGTPLDTDRRAFTTYSIPPKDYDKKKAATMKGMIARFFIALGESEEKVVSPKFDPDFEDYIGTPCTIVLSKEEYPKNSGEYQNRVKGVKAAGSGSGNAPGLL